MQGKFVHDEIIEGTYFQIKKYGPGSVHPWRVLVKERGGFVQVASFQDGEGYSYVLYNSRFYVRRYIDNAKRDLKDTIKDIEVDRRHEAARKSWYKAVP